jgi:hypothetical protein
MKSELVNHKHYQTRKEAIKEITEYIEVSIIGRDIRNAWAIYHLSYMEDSSLPKEQQHEVLVSTISIRGQILRICLLLIMGK